MEGSGTRLDGEGSGTRLDREGSGTRLDGEGSGTRLDGEGPAWMEREAAPPNILDYKNGMAPLHITCCPNGSLEMAQVILSCPNTDPNILDGKHDTPLVSSNAQPKLLSTVHWTFVTEKVLRHYTLHVY